MSRIGNWPVSLPKDVSVTVADNNEVTVKGPKGELKQAVDKDITVNVEEGQIIVERPTNQKRHKAMHGLYRSLLSNMIEGVNTGYIRKLEFVGVGFRATAQNQVLEMQVGYSHPVIMALPPEVKVSAEQQKGKNPIVTLESIDKQLVGQMAAKIRSIRKPEPYKGKGIKYVDEYIRRKAGKSAAAK